MQASFYLYLQPTIILLIFSSGIGKWFLDWLKTNFKVNYFLTNSITVILIVDPFEQKVQILFDQEQFVLEKLLTKHIYKLTLME